MSDGAAHRDYHLLVLGTKLASYIQAICPKMWIQASYDPTKPGHIFLQMRRAGNEISAQAWLPVATDQDFDIPARAAEVLDHYELVADYQGDDDELP